MRRAALLLAALAGLASAPAAAGGVDKLRSFLRETRSGQAQFRQSVLDRNQKLLQEASGTFQFERPGRFRWVYERPYDQLIVGDGARFWLYDKELNQVTARKLDQALGSSPAALLAGSDAIEKNFTLSELGEQGGLEWAEALPKTRETGFERVRLGFTREGLLESMELRDYFGQTTVLKFSMIQKNPKLAPELFRFTAPANADVVGE